MFRKYVIITLAALFFIGGTGCTSKKAQDDSADVEASADDESLESAEATENNEDLDAGSEETVADTGEGAGGDDGLAPEEQLPDDTGAEIAENADEIAPSDLEETTPADGSEVPQDSLASSEAPAADLGGDEVAPPPADIAASEPTSETPAPEISAPVTPEPSYDEAPKPSMSLKKIASQPYKQGKTLVNAVYLAREGDTVEGISQKVFASTDHVKEICRINSYNCSRPIKVGDKFYYNSPQRPNDDTVIKTFYEDAGVQPQMYTSKQGDNIRKVGKELLGHERSWMELWATNDVESKGDLDEGVSLRYWPATETAAPVPTLADTGAPPPAEQPGGEAPPMDPGAGGQAAATTDQPMDAAPPAEDLAMNNPPPDMGQEQLPPPPDANAAGSIEPPPPPPPPPPTDMAQAGGDMSAVEDPNQQNFMLGVGAVLLLAAAALFISIRKKRARRQIDFNTTTQTQIE